MSKGTEISWADNTWNLGIGCERVSRGCARCYVIPLAHMRSSNPNPKVAAAFAGLVERNADGELDWTGQINLLPDRLYQPLRATKPAKWFVNSLADLFFGFPKPLVAQAFAVMRLADRHIFQIATKRPGVARSWLSSPAFRLMVDEAVIAIAQDPASPLSKDRRRKILAGFVSTAWPVENVWVGVSVEDQASADLRLPILRGIPAAVRWISAEPLTGQLDLRVNASPRNRMGMFTDCPRCDASGRDPLGGRGFAGNCSRCRGARLVPFLDWVVTGGESGTGAVPTPPRWFRSLRDQCVDNRVRFHFKQWGVWAPAGPDDPRRQLVDGAGALRSTNDLQTFTVPADWAWMARVGKKAAGRVLDNRIWDEYPTAADGR